MRLEVCPGRISIAESESEIKNDGKQPPEAKNDENRNLNIHCFGFLVTTRTGSLGFGPDLVGIFPRGLPQLSKQLRDQNNSQAPRKKRKIEFKKNILFMF